MKKEASIKPAVIIATHAVFVGENAVFGPGHAVSSYLTHNAIPNTYIIHSLYDARPSVIIEKNKGKEKTTKKSLSRLLPGHFRYPFEMITTIAYIAKHKNAKVFIGLNPLNTVAGIIAKKLGYIKTVIFYTADYAHARFSNTIMNNIYHAIDRFALKHADEIWNVSSRITDLRKKQVGKKKNITMPNTPLLANMAKFKKDKKKKNSLVLMANFTPAIEYELIVDAIDELKNKYPDILISFIGSGPKEHAIKTRVKSKKLGKHVLFHGYKTHDEALSIVAEHQIGLALYANQFSWTEFGDSLKAREYLALGLPVLINDHISTGDDITKYKAGFAFKLTQKKLISIIDSIFSDKETYKQLSKNANKMAEDIDLKKLLDTHLYPLL